LDLAQRLTPEQRAAVKHRGAVACVVAGAGTGKTLTLCERISWLVEKRGCEPDRIVVTTFSRKATAELFQRAKRRIGESATRLRISTIDALIAELAREAAQRGWLPSFQLIGEPEQRVLLRECAQEVWSESNPGGPLGRRFAGGSLGRLFERAYGIQSVLEAAFITEMTEPGPERRIIEGQLRESFYRAIASYWDPTAFLLREFRDGRWEIARNRLKLCIERYQRRVAELGFLDYDGLRHSFAQLLKESDQARVEFGSRYDAMLVDEFQDTSRAQFEVLRALARRNLWIVGDPCQQIYAWRGAIVDPMALAKEAKAKLYFLTKNFRSTQPVLDSAFAFLSARLPSYQRAGALRRLRAAQPPGGASPVYRGTMDQAMRFVAALLASDLGFSPKDVAILSRDLTRRTMKSLEVHARKYSLRIQFHSSAAEGAMERTIAVGGDPPRWRSGDVLNKLYRDKKVGRLLRAALKKGDFAEMRRLRPLATAADAVDRASTLNFGEAWPALRKTQDRDVAVTAAVVGNADAIQAMTIHAAKGLEFPVVLVMKWGRRFPREQSAEDARLAYVGMTRAKQLLVLVHTQANPRSIRQILGSEIPLVPCPQSARPTIPCRPHGPVAAIPPLIAASHLDLYSQCPLKFAAHHDGRFLPPWSKNQSMGSRMHKALELFLCAWPWGRDEALLGRCLRDGIRYGDSPLRRLPPPLVNKMRDGFKKITDDLRRTCRKVVEVERPYRYASNGGVVEGVVDALIEDRDGALVLKEWKTNSEIPRGRLRQFTLQTSAALLGMKAGPSVDVVDLVPVLGSEESVRLGARDIRERAPAQMNRVFSAIVNRNFAAHRGEHCGTCSLKRHCPAW